MTSFKIDCVQTQHQFDELLEHWPAQRDTFCNHNPFMDPMWLRAWWEELCGTNGLFLPVVRDSFGTIALIAPWYLHQSRSRGRELRFLGSGRACGDYLSVLTRDFDSMGPAMDAFAEWLAGNADWDCMNFDGVSHRDIAMRGLFGRLEFNGLTVHEDQQESFWRLNLPTSYDEYLASCQSKIRQKLRKVVRDSQGRVSFSFCEREDQLDEMFDTYVNLHIQRREAIDGKSGCFEHPRFDDFLRRVVKDFFHAGKLLLGELRIDEQQAASCLCFLNDDIVYYYQCGSNPSLAKLQPGWLQNALLIRTAIERGYRAIDFLRGNEPYKSKLTANRIPHTNFRVVANRPDSKIRFKVWQLLKKCKNLPLAVSPS